MKALLAVLMLVALPVAAQDAEVPGYAEGSVATDCGDTFCVIPKAHLDRLVETNQKMYRELAAKAKEAPKCATLEVIEPPKRQIPPLKKERDS